MTPTDVGKVLAAFNDFRVVVTEKLTRLEGHLESVGPMADRLALLELAVADLKIAQAHTGRLSWKDIAAIITTVCVVCTVCTGIIIASR